MSVGLNDLLFVIAHTYTHTHTQAAGNNGKAMAMYPAAYGPVISVSAVRQDYTRWDGSNYDPSVELAAPGDLVLSTCINSKGEFTYCYYSGTSMATPHVAGVAVRCESFI